MRRAAYQDSLASELALLMPRVRNFVETQYAYTPSDRRALDRFLEALSD
jgi:hypothetical protein